MRIDELLSFLAMYFAVERYPATEQGGVYRQSEQPIERLGLALEPDADLGQWAIQQQLDTLWLHRPWHLADKALPPTTGIVYHHLPFDETLTLGFNRPLADSLSLTRLEELGYKQALDQANEPLPQRAVGMIGDVPAQPFNHWRQWAAQAFGGYDQVETGRFSSISRVAAVGAMNEALIHEASDRGATLYLTGQYRKAAQKAVSETGMAVIAVGHRRSEEWGLRALATVLRQQFPATVIEYKKSGQPES